MIASILCGLAPRIAHGADFESDRDATRAIIAAGRHPWITTREFADRKSEVARFYGLRDFAPAWLDGGSPTPNAGRLLEILNSAPAHGLDSSDYDPDRLAAGLDALRSAAAEPRHIALLDSAMTFALFRYLTDVRIGRIDPRAVGFDIDPVSRRADLARSVHDAVRTGALLTLAESSAPRLPMYRRLAATLARYRALSEQDGFAPLPRVRKLVDGEPYAGIAALHRRLVRFGDLPGDTPEPARYEGAIVDAVKRFQARHGLLSDGIVGKATLAALDVPPRRRVRQIELAMERMRWLPEWTEGRSILVNIPEFRLRGYELDTGAEVLVMKVIVGQALETETPIFQGQMRHVEFKPYWNVPRSIARDEIVPKLRLDPGYLAEQDMELVSTRRPMAVTTVVNAANLDAVLRGELRIRQRPGPKNALGDIKFAFPNESSIYLHHTSSPRLFQRGRRDFSHGCVRVEDPVGLARFLLADRPDWTEQRILEAMQEESPPQTVRLSAPVPVLLFYTTVVVEDGQRVLFLPDIYRHDEALELALETNRRGR